MNALALLLLLLQAAQSVPSPAVPDIPGVYFRQDQKNWASLQKPRISTAKAEGLDLFVATGGYTDLAMEAVIQGAKAPARFVDAKPLLYVRGAFSPEDFTLIQLSRKKRSRTFRTSSGDSAVGNKPGFRNEEIRRVSVKVYPDGSFSVTPEKDLDPGEYLLVLGDVDNSFDFGIERKK